MENNPKGSPHFDEGDIFYTGGAREYRVYKLLCHEAAFNTCHVLVYAPLDHEPAAADVPRLSVFIYHTPIDSKGFANARLLAKSTVTDDDLMGYREYILQTGNEAERMRLTKKYYQEGYYLGKEGHKEAAIEKYDLAIELSPFLFQAIDNRGFCKMDLSRWEQAIADFERSLTVKPESVLAEFSLGECHLRLGDRKKAVAQFKKVLAIEPDNELGKKFLAKAMALK